MKRNLFSIFMVIAMLIGMLPVVPTLKVSASLDTDTNLQLWYKFNDGSGTTVTDASGHSRNGTLMGGSSWVSDLGDGAVNLDGSSGYVKMPNGILAGMNSITVSAQILVDSANVNPAWVYTFGNSTDPANNANATYLGFVMDNTPKYRVVLTKTRWTNEKSTIKSAAFTKGVWKSVIYTQTGTTGTLYVDGTQVAQNTAVTYTPNDMEATIANYIGKPAYTADKYLKGKIGDFRIYDRALSASEVAELVDTTLWTSFVAADKASLTLGDTSAVTKDLTLPTVGTNGCNISWASSEQNIVVANGLVTRPAEGSPDSTVTLTATIRKGNSTDTKPFLVTVLADQPTSAQKILHYDMNNIVGTTVTDSIGSFNGTWVDSQNAALMENGGTKVLSFPGGSTSSYIEIPQGLLNGLTGITVSSLVNWKGGNQAEWIFGLGTNNATATLKKYLYTTPQRNSGSYAARLGFGLTGWSNEAGADSTKGALQAGEWKLITAVISEADGIQSLYIDGVKVSSSSTNGYTLAQINNTTGISGYIGKSFYDVDPYFGGMIADVKIYNKAMNGTEIKALKTAADQKIVNLKDLTLNYAADQIKYSDFINSNVSKDEIISNLSLPQKGQYRTTITWQSNNSAFITNEGKVKRPSYNDTNRTVVLTATVSDGTNTVTRNFPVTVLKRTIEDLDTVKSDAQLLKVYNLDDVRGNLTLPAEGKDGSTIMWTSENPSIITPTGEVNRPSSDSQDVTVKLTAKITLYNATITKAFLANVRKKPAPQNNAGYMFAYFIGEGSATQEQMYFALSQGNDPLHWNNINGGNPVFTSNLGEGGLRDPVIVRSPEGDKFYLIATDLKIYGNGDWTRAQRTGSRSIMVWESTDLVNWSEQRMVEVSGELAGCTWAPEAFYDRTTGEYIVYWASKIYSDASKTGSPNQRIMYAKTRDFYTFTEAKEYFNPGYSVIDTTAIEHNGTIYRFTKDERNYDATNAPNGKHIFQEKGTSFLGNFEKIIEGLDKPYLPVGEGPLVFKANGEDKWYLFVDYFSGGGYKPFYTTDLNSGNWTYVSSGYSLPNPAPRHGTVMPITQTEYDSLQAKVPTIKAPSTDIKTAGVTLDKTNITVEMAAYTQLTATVAPSNAVNKQVLWSSNNENIAKVDNTGKVTAVSPGNAIITATTVDGGFIEISKVTVLPNASGIMLNKTYSTLNVGQMEELVATVTPSNAMNKTVTFSCYNTNVAAVSSSVYDPVSGTTKVVVTAKSTGVAQITATTADGKQNAQYILNVIQPANGIALNKTTNKLDVGQMDVLVATITPSNATDKTVTFVSSNPSVATVGNAVYDAVYGTTKVTITAKAPGTTKITAITAGGSFSAEYVLAVNGTSSSDDSSDSTTIANVQPTQPTTKVEGATIVANAILDKATGTAKIEVSNDILQKALEKSVANSKGLKTVEINIPKVEGAKVYEPVIPAGYISNDTRNEIVKIKTPLAIVELPNNMLLSNTQVTTTTKAEVPIETADKSIITNPVVKEKIGDRPIVEVNLKLDGKVVKYDNTEAQVKISIPYAPSEQEKKNPEHIIVWGIDEHGNAVKVTNAKYDEKTGMVSFKTPNLNAYAVSYEQITFEDMNDHNWAKHNVEVLASKGIINGKTDKTYAPEEKITRADFLLLLVKTLGITAKFDSNFSDVSKSDYYYDAIGIAKKVGIIQGEGSNKFNPNEQISRQDMMVMCARALNVSDVIKTQGSVADLQKFTDKTAVASYAVDAIGAMVKEGIVTGNGNNINPLDNATRAESAVIMYRIYNK